MVLINDVNSNNRGRDYFEKLVEKLDGEGLIENSQGYYFDYNIRNEFQRYGIKHESNRIVYNILIDFLHISHGKCVQVRSF